MTFKRLAFPPILSLNNLSLNKRREKEEEHHAHELGCAALCCACSGQCAIVSHFAGDADEAARLRDLGLREGAVVTVLRDGDPLVVGVDDARFGIGRAAAMNIMCQIVK